MPSIHSYSGAYLAQFGIGYIWNRNLASKSRSEIWNKYSNSFWTFGHAQKTPSKNRQKRGWKIFIECSFKINPF